MLGCCQSEEEEEEEKEEVEEELRGEAEGAGREEMFKRRGGIERRDCEGVSPAATSALDSVWTTSEDCMVVSMDANVRGPEAEVVMVKAMITPRALLLLLLLDNDDDNDAVNDDVDDDALLLDNDDDDNGGDVDDVGCGGIPLINSNSSPPINFLPRILLALAATLLMTN